LNRELYVSVYMKYKGAGNFYKKIRGLGPGLINRLLWPLKFFLEGKTVIAIFNKTV